MQAIILSLFMVMMTFTNTQQSADIITRTISGTVYDDGLRPLIGANVVVKGTTNATITDFNGHYEIQVRPGDKYLVVSYIGYHEEQALIGNSDTINIAMSSGVELAEVVVAGSKPKRKINGAASSNVIVRGSRIDAMQYYNDGIRVAGTTLPTKSNPNLSNTNSEINWNTEDYDAIAENSFKSPELDMYSTFSIDTDGASYSNLRRMLRSGQTPPIDAVRIEEMINYFKYDYQQPEAYVPFEIVTELARCPWKKEHQLLHIGLQGREIPKEDLPASNLVFLLDVSGSMNAANKLPLVKQSFKMLTGQLREQDRVAIVVYAGSSGLVLPSTSGSDSQVILEALDRLQAGGSTAGAAGIKLAYNVAMENYIEGGNNRVILATDGDFNIGMSSDGEMVRLIEEKRESGVFLSVLGYGMGNYKDNKMQKLANHGNGNHSYIDDITEAKKVFVNEFGGTLFTIAKDVKIQIEFNPDEVAGYRLIGYENRMLNAEDFNDDKKDAGEIGSGHTVTALYEIIPVGVESEFMPDVDEPKFTKEGKANRTARNQSDLMHLKVRFKQPDGNKSSLVEQMVRYTDNEWENTSDNFRWSASVAAFGMILRDSKFKGAATTDLVVKLAEGAKGVDEFGYRGEFIHLVNGIEPVIALETEK